MDTHQKNRLIPYLFTLAAGTALISQCKKESKPLAPQAQAPIQTRLKEPEGDDPGACLALAEGIPARPSRDPASLKVTQVTFDQSQIQGFSEGAVEIRSSSEDVDTFYYRICQIEGDKACLSGTSLSGLVYSAKMPEGPLKIEAQACLYPERAREKRDSDRVSGPFGFLYCGPKETGYGTQKSNSAFPKTLGALFKRDQVDAMVRERCKTLYEILGNIPGSVLEQKKDLKVMVTSVQNLGPEGFCQNMQSNFLETLQMLTAMDQVLGQQGVNLASGSACDSADDIVDQFQNTPPPKFEDPFKEGGDELGGDKVPEETPKPEGDGDTVVTTPKDDKGGEVFPTTPTDDKKQKEESYLGVFALGGVLATAGIGVFALTANQNRNWYSLMDALPSVQEKLKKANLMTNDRSIDKLTNTKGAMGFISGIFGKKGKTGTPDTPDTTVRPRVAIAAIAGLLGLGTMGYAANKTFNQDSEEKPTPEEPALALASSGNALSLEALGLSPSDQRAFKQAAYEIGRLLGYDSMTQIAKALEQDAPTP
jgi:hypothetical protein